MQIEGTCLETEVLNPHTSSFCAIWSADPKNSLDPSKQGVFQEGTVIQRKLGQPLLHEDRQRKLYSEVVCGTAGARCF